MRLSTTVAVVVCCVWGAVSPRQAVAQSAAEKLLCFPVLDKDKAPSLKGKPPVPKPPITNDTIKMAYISVYGQDKATQPATFVFMEANQTAFYLDKAKAVGKKLKPEGIYLINTQKSGGISCDAYSCGDVWFYIAEKPEVAGEEQFYCVFKGKKGVAPDEMSWSTNAPR